MGVVSMVKNSVRTGWWVRRAQGTTRSFEVRVFNDCTTRMTDRKAEEVRVRS